jgi:transcription elongation factor GreA
MDDSQKISLGEAASRFLGSIPPEKVTVSQQMLYQFVRWFGRERCLDDLSVTEIANYCGTIPTTDADCSQKLDIIRGFLADARKKTWTRNNLAAHIKTKKGKSRTATVTGRGSPEAVILTRDGFEEIIRELGALKEKRLETIEDIRRAAADKDFRENAPLDAAREQLSHIEGRIKEMKETIKVASVLDDQPEPTRGVSIGDSVVLTCLDTGEEVRYTIVSPREVDPARGRISGLSPLGRAIVGRGSGNVIEIVVPAGKQCYRIEKFGR